MSQSTLHLGTRVTRDTAFRLPLAVGCATIAILARKGRGKTYTAAVFAEELLETGQVPVIIDPTGAHWGLKSSADGTKDGYPVVVFGGEHADLPLEEHAGETIARAIVEQRFPAILDLSLMRKNEMKRFLAVFFETVYRLNREPIHLLCDEADVYAPQKPFGDEARVLGAMEDIVRRGRIRGIGCTMITQRPQVLNKNVLTQADMLIALGMNHPRDMQAIEEWVAVHGDMEKAAKMMASLPSMEIGTAWFWAPALDDLFEQVRVRARRTFDSSATPKPGEKVVAPKRLAEIDVAKLGKEIAETAARAKENDPKELKKELAGLKQSNSQLVGQMQEINTIVDAVLGVGGTGTTFATPVHGVEKLAEELRRERKRLMAMSVPALGREDVLEIRSSTNALMEKVGKFAETVNHFAGRLEVAIRDKHDGEARNRDTLTSITYPRVGLTPEQVESMGRVERPARVGSGSGSPEVGNGGLRRILIAIAQRPGIDHRQLGLRACLSSRSGTFSTYLAKARTNGWVSEGNGFRITEAGIAALGAYEPLPTGTALRDYWLNDLGRTSGAARMLEALCAVYPQSLTNDQLGERADISSRSGTFSTYLSKLRGLELVEGRGELRASAELFD